MMTERRAKPKAKGTSQATKPRKLATRSKSAPKAGARAKPGPSEAEPAKLLAGRNPPIAKADGDAPVPAGKASREPATGKPASRLIDQRIRDLGGWRGETLARMRALILEADPEMTEEWKWMGTPVWSHDGIVCTGESYTKIVKLTFARGASVPDPSRLFNSSLEGNTRRAIDIHEGEKVDAGAFKALVKAAVAQNGPPAKKARPDASEAKPVKLLSGGNPPIAKADKADGESAVLANIAEMPGPDRALGERFHAIIKASAPGLSPRLWYGMPAYAKDGKVLCFFQSAQKFKTRYATLGFMHVANLDEGAMWPTAFALKELTAAEEARIGALVKKAVG
jgi:hypothetical protein